MTMTNIKFNFKINLLTTSIQEVRDILMGKCGVYMFVNRETNESYIGSSIDLRRRFNEYCNYVARNAINRDSGDIFVKLKEYGVQSFDLYLLENYSMDDIKFGKLTSAELVEAEQRYIDLYSPQYNVRTDTHANVGHSLSDATRKKMSEAKKGKTYRKGAVRAESSKILQSQNSSLVKTVLTFDSKTGVFLKKYSSIKDCEADVNVSRHSIKRAADNQTPRNNLIFRIGANNDNS